MITQIVFLPIHSSSGHGRPLTEEDVKIIIGILIVLHTISVVWFLIRYFLIKSGKITKEHEWESNYNLYMPFGLEMAAYVPLVIDGIIVLFWLGTLIAKLL